MKISTELNPLRVLRYTWKAAAIVAVLVLAVGAPLHLAVGMHWFFGTTTAILTFTVLFVGDFLLRAFYIEPKPAHAHWMPSTPPKKSRHLLAADFVACIPFGLLGGGLYPGLELIRLVKLARVQQALGRLKRSYAFNPTILRMANFFFWMLLLTHWLACFWIFLGGVPHTNDLRADYVRGMYWAVTTLSTVGYGDITPNTEAQMIYTIAVMIVGVGAYGFVIGNVASLLSHVDVARSKFLEKMDRVDAYLRHNEIPSQMRERIREYYQYMWENKLGLDEDVLLKDLVQHLRADILLFIRKPLIEKVPVFRNAGEAFLRDVIFLLRPQVYLPGDEIIRYGEIGETMYFLSAGEVEVLSATGEKLAVLKEGDHFGEVAILKAVPRTATVRAIDFCHVYEVHRDDVRELFRTHPQFEAQVRKRFDEHEMQMKKEAEQQSHDMQDTVET